MLIVNKGGFGIMGLMNDVQCLIAKYRSKLNSLEEQLDIDEKWVSKMEEKLPNLRNNPKYAKYNEQLIGTHLQIALKEEMVELLKEIIKDLTI